MIFYRKDLKDKIDSAVFPVGSCQSRLARMYVDHAPSPSAAWTRLLACTSAQHANPACCSLTRAPCSQGLQGGPHNHTISALAVALKMANTEEFRTYQQQVRRVSRVVAPRMM
jgi:glycine/serine hydroxymethyltransferase